jgi:hypothetical protein
MDRQAKAEWLQMTLKLYLLGPTEYVPIEDRGGVRSPKRHVLNKGQDDVRNYDSYINTPSLQTCTLVTII